ncbi:MAG: hypothetical protein ACLP01_24550 [Solirubrobacteraceae bacterium]
MLRPGDLKALAGGLLGTPPAWSIRNDQPSRPDRWLLTFEDPLDRRAQPIEISQ